MSISTDVSVNYFPVESPISWDQYFMLQAMIASFKSKDPSTKVGAVIVDSENHQVTMGYNGFVAGIDEGLLPWGKDKSVPLEHQKYGYVVHAETNAILHSNRSLRGCRVYVTLFPCNECAKLIASKGISEIVFLSDKHADKEGTRISKKIFDLASIKYRQLTIEDGILGKFSDHMQTINSDI